MGPKTPIIKDTQIARQGSGTYCDKNYESKDASTVWEVFAQQRPLFRVSKRAAYSDRLKSVLLLRLHQLAVSGGNGSDGSTTLAVSVKKGTGRPKLFISSRLFMPSSTTPIFSSRRVIIQSYAFQSLPFALHSFSCRFCLCWLNCEAAIVSSSPW